MEILLLQTDIAWGKPETNRAHARSLIGNARAELIVLPEMFSSGFNTEPAEVAESDGQTLGWMKHTAAESGAALAGSVAVAENGKHYNRFYFVKPNGSAAAYDKRHLFSYGGEDRKYAAGDERVIVEHAGFRILLQTCYDLRFPVFARNRGDYDMILYAANWPQTRRNVWDTLLRARAIENACYVAGVNRVGGDPSTHYEGGTALVDFKGRTIAQAQDGRQEAVRGTADMTELRNYRSKFPVLEDADEFSLSF